jgi:hypothetical protein
LTAAEIEGLDKLLAQYRSLTPGFCTTTHTIGMVQRRGGKVIANESFFDASCSTFASNGMTTFQGLLARLEKQF